MDIKGAVEKVMEGGLEEAVGKLLGEGVTKPSDLNEQGDPASAVAGRLKGDIAALLNHAQALSKSSDPRGMRMELDRLQAVANNLENFLSRLGF